MSERPERMFAPSGLPGWRVLLGLGLVVFGIALGLVLLLRESGAGVSPGLSASNPRGLYVMDADGKHKRLLVSDFHGAWPAYSSDGKGQIFVGSAQGDSIGTVFSTLVSGRSSPYATGEAADLWRPDSDGAPAWSADRRYVLAIVSEGGRKPAGGAVKQSLFLAEVSDGRLVTRGVIARSERRSDYMDDGLLAVSWSRTGKAVYLDRSKESTALWLLDHPERPGAAPKRLLEGSSLAGISTVALAPDGSKLAYLRDSDSGLDESAVHVLDLETLATRSFRGSSESGYRGPGSGSVCWSPDGRSLVFTGGGEFGVHLYRADLASGKVTQLTESAGDGGREMQPAFSPDGTRVVYIAQRGYEGDDEIPVLP